MSATDLESRTRYDPAEAEPRVSRAGRSPGSSTPSPRATPDENYSIAIPPPNVTGALHMGHALNGSIQDALIRLNRMRGRRTKWILGTDHAGIATQTQVEKAAASRGHEPRGDRPRGVRRARVGVARAVRLARSSSSSSASAPRCDYEDERFTLDDGYARAVLKVFVDLYEKGLIYRDNYMVNWDPGSRSAISDLEVEEREVTDTLYYVDYPLASGDGSVTVATVRPETMLGRHRDRRAPRRRALHAAGRGDGDPAARRPPPADHRRRRTSSPSSAPAR